MKWQSTKIKPKNDRDVLIYFDSGVMEVCNWCNEEKEWQQDGYNICNVESGARQPTHWAALPKPPQE